MAVDVTERKARERELERYEPFIENSHDVDTLVDQYRGSVRVEDNDPEGTVVVELPRATAADGD